MKKTLPPRLSLVKPKAGPGRPQKYGNRKKCFVYLEENLQERLQLLAQKFGVSSMQELLVLVVECGIEKLERAGPRVDASRRRGEIPGWATARDRQDFAEWKSHLLPQADPSVIPAWWETRRRWHVKND